jgi:hypothetical protein
MLYSTTFFDLALTQNWLLLLLIALSAPIRDPRQKVLSTIHSILPLTSPGTIRSALRNSLRKFQFFILFLKKCLAFKDDVNLVVQLVLLNYIMAFVHRDFLEKDVF